MKPTQDFHHCALVVNNLEACLEWYQEKLEFQIESRFYLPEALLEIVYLVSPGGFRLELIARHRSSLEPSGPVVSADLISPGRMHICFLVEDIQAAAETLRLRQVTFIQEPKTIEAAGVKNFWIADVEGNRIEFLEMIPNAN